jgi:hypothetical protein
MNRPLQVKMNRFVDRLSIGKISQRSTV